MLSRRAGSLLAIHFNNSSLGLAGMEVLEGSKKDWVGRMERLATMDNGRGLYGAMLNVTSRPVRKAVLIQHCGKRQMKEELRDL